VSRATNDEWDRYYEAARRRRSAVGTDPLDAYLERREARQKRIFISCNMLLLGVVVAFYSLLIR
jgi:type II secretory pathway component PulM